MYRYSVPPTIANAMRLNTAAEADWLNGEQDTLCTEDYVGIPGASVTGDIFQPTNQRFCGGILSTTAIGLANVPVRSKYTST